MEDAPSSRKLTFYLVSSKLGLFKTASKLEYFKSWLKKKKNKPRRKPMQFVRYVAHKCLSEVKTAAKSRHYAKIIPNKVKRDL